MKPYGKEVIGMMEILIAKEIKRMARNADICIFTLYNIHKNNAVIYDYTCHNRIELGCDIEIDINYDYSGIGIWYIATRNGDNFSANKILLQIENGHFIHGQMGKVDGKWYDFPNYVTDDNWISIQLAKKPANNFKL